MFVNNSMICWLYPISI